MTTPPPVEDLFCASLPTLPKAFDSTMLGLIKECPRKFKYIIIDGWQPVGFAAHLAFGIAYHKALETFDRDLADGLDYDTALLNAVRFCLSYGTRDANGMFIPYDAMYTREPAKTRDTLLRAVVWYLEHFRDDSIRTVTLSTGKPAVELSFKVNLDLETPDGDPFILAGHLDRLVEYDDAIYFTDRKTTKYQITERYWRQFTPNNQISLYYAATQLFLAKPPAGGLIDAVELGASYARFQRRPIHRTPGQQHEWLVDTYHWIGLAMQYAADDYWPMNDKSCLPGDTIVSYKRGKNKQKTTLDKLVEMQLNPSWRSAEYPLEVLADVGGKPGYIEVTDAYVKGVRELIGIKTETKYLRATPDHPVLTSEGYVEAGKLTLDHTLVCWKSERCRPWGSKEYQRRWGIYGIKYHPRALIKTVAGRDYKWQRDYRLCFEAAMNDLPLEEFVHILRNDEERAQTLRYLPAGYDVHHKDGDVTNNQIKNLEALTIAEHDAEHYAERVANLLHGKFLHTEVITKISSAGPELVYDISTEAPFHNFIANGVVVHNCGNYGGCPFQPVCQRDPKVRDGFIKAEGYIKRQWNPLESR